MLSRTERPSTPESGVAASRWVIAALCSMSDEAVGDALSGSAEAATETSRHAAVGNRRASPSKRRVMGGAYHRVPPGPSVPLHRQDHVPAPNGPAPSSVVASRRRSVADDDAGKWPQDLDGAVSRQLGEGPAHRLLRRGRDSRRFQAGSWVTERFGCRPFPGAPVRSAHSSRKQASPLPRRLAPEPHQPLLSCGDLPIKSHENVFV